MYTRSGSAWSLQQKLAPADGAAGDLFGFDVALAGDLALVGAWGVDGVAPGADDVGAVYAFTRSGTSWALEARLEPAAQDVDGLFGYSLALDRSGASPRALIGCQGHDGATPGAGAAYVFERTGTSWSERALLFASDGISGELFGASVALHGDTALVGAPFSDLVGAAYVFELEDGAWVERQRLANPTAFLLDQVGRSVELSERFALVGDVQGPGGRNAGAVRVFAREAGEGGSFVETLLLQASDAVDTTDGLAAPFFGWSVDADGEALAVGAQRDDQAGLDAGSVYVFDFGGATFCDASDAGLAACPCAPGEAETGCDLAQGTGGVELTLVAQSTAPQNRATLRGKGFPLGATPAAVVIRSAELDPARPVVFGDGLRCVGLPLVRLGATAASEGLSAHAIGHGPAAGSGLAHYQLWFRNQPASYCDPAAAFNLSNGRSLVW